MCSRSEHGTPTTGDNSYPNTFRDHTVLPEPAVPRRSTGTSATASLARGSRRPEAQMAACRGRFGRDLGGGLVVVIFAQEQLPIPLVREDGGDDVPQQRGIRRLESFHRAVLTGLQSLGQLRVLHDVSLLFLRMSYYTPETAKSHKIFFGIMGTKRACPRFGEGGQAFVLGIQVYS